MKRRCRCDFVRTHRRRSRHRRAAEAVSHHAQLAALTDSREARKSTCAAAARELVLAMVPKVDVVVGNFAPGVMKRMGFFYEDLNRVNPKIIMCSISMAGQTGPLSTRAGYDPIGQSYAGITDGMGEKDRAPSVTTGAPPSKVQAIA
jgi:crotonobetainyl-CoA:carnitine CoA-transferase CaiB-like acyl-CoA transferase